MTVRAEKSTRFPIKFPLTLPFLPFRRDLIDFNGLPDNCIALNSKTDELVTFYTI